MNKMSQLQQRIMKKALRDLEDKFSIKKLDHGGYLLIKDGNNYGIRFDIEEFPLRATHQGFMEQYSRERRQKCPRNIKTFVIYLGELRDKTPLERKPLLLVLIWLACIEDLRITDIYIFYNDKKLVNTLNKFGFLKNGNFFRRSIDQHDRHDLIQAVQELYGRESQIELRQNQKLHPNQISTECQHYIRLSPPSPSSLFGKFIQHIRSTI